MLGQSPNYDLGNINVSTFAVNVDNGPHQFGYISTNVTFLRPIGRPSEGKTIFVSVYANNADRDVNFDIDNNDSGKIALPTNSALGDSLPLTIPVWNTIIFSFKFTQGNWNLVMLENNFPERVD